MKPPMIATYHPDYGLECEQALAPLLLAVIDQVHGAGWDDAAIWPALRSLIDNLEIKESENWQAAQVIAKLRAGLAKPE